MDRALLDGLQQVQNQDGQIRIFFLKVPFTRLYIARIVLEPTRSGEPLVALDGFGRLDWDFIRINLTTGVLLWAK